MKGEFFVVVERDEDGFYIGEVPALRACYAQGKTMDEMLSNIREVIELCLEEQQGKDVQPLPEFVGVQKIIV